MSCEAKIDKHHTSMLYFNQFTVSTSLLKGGIVMATHTLTTEQVQKFIDAIGGVPRSITGGQFTTQQLKTLAESVKGLQDWPNFTDDPQVNFAVDCVVEDDGEEPSYDERLYTAEVEAYKARGLFA